METPTGTWETRPLFPEGPENIRRTACSYLWTTAAPPDVGALRALDPRYLTRSSAGADVHVPITDAKIAPLTPIPIPIPIEEGGPQPIGAAGCDVCAVIDDNEHAFVILPGEHLSMHSLLARRSDGTFVELEIVPSGAQVFSVRLPTLEQGATYVSGPARLF